MAKQLDPPAQHVLTRLATHYGFPRHGNPRDVFFCAVYVLLSAQTTLEQAALALRVLRRQWPTAEELSVASPGAVHEAIRSCGFGTTRTEKILLLAQAVANDPRKLRSLRRLSDTELEARLVSLPGIGFKTARVVAAMSSLERDRFAIDTHIWRIAQRLGRISKRRTDRKPTERQASALEERIPAESRRHLHAVLVSLGRDTCRLRQPECGRCVLVEVCAYGKRATKCNYA